MACQIVRDHFETFRAHAASLRDGGGLPRFVEQEFRSFLRCGWLAGGFARFREAVRVNPGDLVRIYFVNVGPGTSAAHVIGSVFDGRQRGARLRRMASAAERTERGGFDRRKSGSL